MDIKEFKKRMSTMSGNAVMLKGKDVRPGYKDLTVHRQLLTVLKGHVGAK